MKKYNFPQILIQHLNLQTQHKKKTTRIKPMEKIKTKIGLPSHTSAEEQGKSQTYSSTLTQEYPLRAPTLYNSQNQNWPVILRNRTRAAFVNLSVTHAKCHIMDKATAFGNRDIRNTYDI